MSNIVTPFPSIERALKLLLIKDYPLLQGDPEAADLLVGSDLSFDPRTSDDFYIRVAKVDSQTTRLEGDFIVDIEVFGVNYLETESRSLDIEALLLGYPRSVDVDGYTLVIDKVSQNTGPRELPWEDDEVSRLGATYVLTARRR